MLRLALALLTSIASVVVATAAVAVGDSSADLADNVVATRARAETVRLAVTGERRVGARLVWGAYGDATSSTTGARARYEVAIEGAGAPRRGALVVVDGAFASVRSDALAGVIAPSTWARVRVDGAPATAPEAVVRGLLAELPLGLAPLDVVAAQSEWLRDAPEELHDGSPLTGWRAHPDVDAFLAALPPDQAQRWRLQLAAVDEAQLTVRAHLDDDGLVRRVELLVRGDADGVLLQRRHVVELRDFGRAVDLAVDGDVLDLSGTVGA